MPGTDRVRKVGGSRKIPGAGPIVATALIAEVGDWFSSGRNLAAWIGLVPKQHSTGGKERLGGISKQGNHYLRWLLIAGAMAVIRYARQHGTRRLWIARIMERRPIKVAAVAIAPVGAPAGACRGDAGRCQQRQAEEEGGNRFAHQKAAPA